MTSRAPRVARWIIGRVLPGDVCEDVTGDLEELFRRRRMADGGTRAHLWYWRQVASFFFHFTAARLITSGRKADMSTGLSWIDFKLAVRMLARFPGLTIVSVLGMAVGMAIATGAFTIAFGLLDASLPLPESERVVSIINWDASTNNRETRKMRDFAEWREHLASIEDIGAARTVTRNLIAAGAQPEPVTVAEMTASGFRVARAEAALGRYILPEDERAGSPPVVVIGHDVWTRRFGGDPGIVGRPLQLGTVTYSVIGVMPEGFAFPVNHGFWVPWREDAAAYAPRTGPSVDVFGRLAPGVTLEAAQAELTAIGERAAAAFPATHQHLRPRVIPYAHAFTDMDDPDNAIALHAIQIAIVLLLTVVCVNVAILVYARTATRQGEIAVRTALGASRRRIVSQLFVEALVLAGAAAFIGIGLVSTGLRYLDGALRQLAGPLPFWLTFDLSTAAVIYVVGLTVFAAAIVGIVPAVKATGRRVQAGLQGLSAGSGSRMQMGRLWTALIVAQVAIAVAILPAAMFHAWNSLRFRVGDRGYAAHEFLTMGLALDGAREPYARRHAEFERALEADPGVAAVTFSLAPPGGDLAAVLEVDGVPTPVDPVNYNIVEGTKRGHLVRFNRVARDFFEVFEVPVLTGRGFEPYDTAPTADAVLVNRAFVERMFGTANPLGRRIKYVGRSREAGEGNVTLDRWYEIVGVVQNFPASVMRGDGSDARIYHAVAHGDLYPAAVAVRVRGMAPSGFAGRLREITAAVDPNLQLRNVTDADESRRREQAMMRLIGVTISAAMLSVVALSGAGIYSLMSLTVARRRKEIGIRTALGADPVRILAGIFSRAFAQLGIGVAMGLAGAMLLESVLEGEMFQGRGAVILPAVAVLMTAVGLAATIVPARRGLSIQPTEALREE